MKRIIIILLIAVLVIGCDFASSTPATQTQTPATQTPQYIDPIYTRSECSTFRTLSESLIELHELTASPEFDINDVDDQANLNIGSSLIRLLFEEAGFIYPDSSGFVTKAFITCGRQGYIDSSVIDDIAERNRRVNAILNRTSSTPATQTPPPATVYPDIYSRAECYEALGILREVNTLISQYDGQFYRTEPEYIAIGLELVTIYDKYGYSYLDGNGEDELIEHYGNVTLVCINEGDLSREEAQNIFE